MIVIQMQTLFILRAMWKYNTFFSKRVLYVPISNEHRLNTLLFSRCGEGYTGNDCTEEEDDFWSTEYIVIAAAGGLILLIFIIILIICCAMLAAQSAAQHPDERTLGPDMYVQYVNRESHGNISRRTQGVESKLV